MIVRRFVILLSVAIFGYVAYELATSPLSWPDLQRLSVATVLALAAARLIQAVVAIAQWKVLQDRLSSVSWPTASEVILPTLYATYFPFRGTVVFLRLYAARAKGVSYLEGGASLLVQFVGKWTLMALALFLLPVAFSTIPRETYLLPVGVVILAGLAYGLRGKGSVAFMQTVRNILGATVASRIGLRLAEIEKLFWSLLWSRAIPVFVVLWLVDNGVTYWAIQLAWGDLGYQIPYPQLLLAGFLAYIVALLAPLPGGFGPMEATYASVLSLLGVPLSAGVTATLLWRVLFMAVDLGISAGSAIIFASMRRRARWARREERTFTNR